jgi:hypothetical protein
VSAVFVVVWNRLIICSLNVLLPDFVWRVVQIALNLDSIPKNIGEICDRWMNKSKDRISNLLIFGCGAMFWAIWRTRNYWFFGEKILLDPANIIFICCFWLDSWAIRQREKEKRWWSKEAG